MKFLLFSAGMLAGLIIGVVLTALCAASGAAARREELLREFEVYNRREE